MARRTDLERELKTLIQAQAAVRDQQVQLARLGAQRAFAAVRDWRDPKQTAAAVTAAVKVVTAAQRRVASTTDAYMARSTSAITGKRWDTVGAVDVRSLRRKLPQDVIERLAEGKTVTEALAERAQVTSFLSQRKPRGVVGYRRVLHPELGSGAPPCGLCVVAATRIYHIEELMPIHARCRCSVAVVTKEADPGLKLNDDDLKTLLATVYSAAGGNTRNQLKTVRVEIAEHGELGPILVNADQNFRGPADFARTQSQDLEKKWLAELETLQEQLTGLVGRAGESDDIDQAIKWNKQKIRELSARLP
jgi:hypothetical protein